MSSKNKSTIQIKRQLLCEILIMQYGAHYTNLLRQRNAVSKLNSKFIFQSKLNRICCMSQNTRSITTFLLINQRKHCGECEDFIVPKSRYYL